MGLQQTMLVRHALRSGNGASVLMPVRSARFSRALSTSKQGSASVVTNTPTGKPNSSNKNLVRTKGNKPTALANHRSGIKVVRAFDENYPTSGRKRRVRVVNQVTKAKLLLKWSWMSAPAQNKALKDSLNTREYPEWLESTYNIAKTYRSARSRLWIPTAKEITAVTGNPSANPDAWLAQKLEESSLGPASEPQQRLDFALRRFWTEMSAEARSDALVRVKFDCIRKLGWRQGYSSGYPRPQQGEKSHLPTSFGANSKEGLAAFKQFHQGEEEMAWDAWLALTPQQRTAEHKAAWISRDRSLVYLDDSESSKILGASAPRWFSVPERAGELSFLPNTIVKLVKNFTREGMEYDPWKATFRVPLNMHKHGLRTYLLQIYGLKTTWARSMIYRTPMTRNSRTYEKITGRGRTHKKVEVGLLEPFLFPETSPDFQKRELFSSEMDYEQRRTYLKMTKGTRWRGRKDVSQYEQELANRHRNEYHNLDPLSSPGIHPSETDEFKKFPRLIVRSRGLPTAKHGKILELLSKERREKDARVNELIEQYRQEARAHKDSTSS